MSSQEQAQSGDARQERFDNPELGSGVRVTGTDAPAHGSAGRPAGTVDEDANPPISDPSKSDVYGRAGQLPRKTPAPPSRHVRVGRKARRKNRQAPRELAVQTSAAQRARSRIPTTSRRARRRPVVAQLSHRPTSNRPRRHRSPAVMMTRWGLRTLQVRARRVRGLTPNCPPRPGPRAHPRRLPQPTDRSKTQDLDQDRPRLRRDPQHASPLRRRGPHDPGRR
jgi:hypothetical protein